MLDDAPVALEDHVAAVRREGRVRVIACARRAGNVQLVLPCAVRMDEPDRARVPATAVEDDPVPVRREVRLVVLDSVRSVRDLHRMRTVRARDPDLAPERGVLEAIPRERDQTALRAGPR